MTTRERILLALMGVSLALGAVSLFFPKISKHAGTEMLSENEILIRQAREVTREIAKNVSSLSLKPEQRLVFAAADRPVTNNPFYVRKSEPYTTKVSRTRTAQPEDPEPPVPLYSGYIATDTQVFAIIDSLEYAVGDKIPSTGDVLRAIKPDKVILYSPSKKHDWELPYTGDDL